MDGTTVTKLSLTTMIGYFLLYLIIHIIIGIFYNIRQKEWDRMTEEERIQASVKQKDDALTHKDILWILKFLVKWWPAIYVIILISMLSAF